MIKIILVILGILILLVITFCFFLGRYIINYIFRPYQDNYEHIKSVDNYAKDAFDAYENKWERHDFSFERDGATIKGEYIVNPSSSDSHKKVVVLCHGHTACRASDLKYGKIFYDLGYNLVIFDERYFGESRADHCTLGDKERYDIAEIIRLSRKYFGEDAFIGILGESMGGASVLLVQEIAKVDFCISDCPFSSTKDLLLSMSREKVGLLCHLTIFFASLVGKLRKYDFVKINPRDVVAVSNVPICFMHGLEDQFIPHEMSEEMFKLCKNSLSEIHLFEGAKHAESIKSDLNLYTTIAQAFVRKVEDKYY